VQLSVADVRARYRKPIKYGMVSVVAVLTGQSVLIFCSAVLGVRPVWANVISVMVGTIPSYLLNRAWVWGKRGSHHFWREVAPFWLMALLGLGFSTLLVHLASQWSEATPVVSAANLTAFGILWVAKYLFLDAVLFKVEDILDPEGGDEELAVG
jgi:putative flippase GtrA